MLRATCPVCGGKGKYYVEGPYDFGYGRDEHCERCDGTGTVYRAPSPHDRLQVRALAWKICRMRWEHEQRAGDPLSGGGELERLGAFLVGRVHDEQAARAILAYLAGGEDFAHPVFADLTEKGVAE